MPKPTVRINQEITAPEVYLIDENKRPLGVVNIDQALYLAYEKDLDLVEIAPNANPPVARLLDYSKYRYEMERQQKQQRAKGKAAELKEIRLSLKIGEHDLAVKAKRAKEFLDKGSRIRVNLQLKGREMMFQNKVQEIFNKFREIVDGEFEQAPARLGNRFNAIIKQRKSNAENQDK